MSADRTEHDGAFDVQEPHLHILHASNQFLIVRHSHTWRPPTDVMEDEDRLVVLVEVAGMKDGKFQVALADRHLIISGARSAHEPTHAGYHQLEVRYGEFRTEVTLPWAADEEQIVARYEDGFLRVELPRAKPRSVRVVQVDTE